LEKDGEQGGKMLRLKQRRVSGAIVAVAGLLLAYPVMAQGSSAHGRPATSTLAAHWNSPEELLRSDKSKAIEALGSGQRVRIEVPQIGRIEGYFYRFEGDTIHLNTQTGMKPIVIDSMNTLSVFRARGKEGAIIGGLFGAVVGFVKWKNEDTPGFPDRGQEGALRWVVGGAAGGIVLGTLVGILVRSWRELYPVNQ